jgi:hypothetical protein
VPGPKEYFAMSMPEAGAARTAAAQVLPDPVFVLGLPRSSAAVVGRMLGRHPQLYGLPETHLLSYRTLAVWWQAAPARKRGLITAVAELYFGGQTEAAVRRASGWLRRRLHMGTGALLEVLAEGVYPRTLVAPSMGLAWRPPLLKRAYAQFPEARFVHLLQHPRDFGEAVLKALAEQGQLGPGARSRELVRLCSALPRPRAAGEDEAAARPGPGRGRRPGGPKRPGRRRPGAPARAAGGGAEPAFPADGPDPQWGWYALNRNLVEFLKGVPPAQVYRLRAEDVLADPDAALPTLARWLGLRDDAAAVEEMKHPERSPFALPGQPAARPQRAEGSSVEGPLPWRSGGKGFAPKVRQMAREFGYA